jgi:esterase
VAASVIYDWSPQPMAEGVQRIVREVTRTPAEFSSRDAAMDFLKELHPTSSDDLLQTRLLCTLKDLPNGGMTWRIDRACTQMRMLDPPEKSWANFAKVSCPALIMRGLKSDILSAEDHAQILKTVPNGVAADIEDAAHMLFEDNPAATVRATETFLLSAYPA